MRFIAIALLFTLANFIFADSNLRGVQSDRVATSGVETTVATTTTQAATTGTVSSVVSQDRKDGKGPKDAPTRNEVLKALDDWGKGLVSIAKAKKDNADYVAVATNAIRKAYNYDRGIVLFKPTVAADIPFRTTFEGALSYFVGGNPNFAEDTGFALKGWKSVSFEIVGIVYYENGAAVQTKTTITKDDDTFVTPYFSMVFSRESKNGKLKIDLHHSSLPYTP